MQGKCKKALKSFQRTLIQVPLLVSMYMCYLFFWLCLEIHCRHATFLCYIFACIFFKWRISDAEQYHCQVRKFTLGHYYYLIYQLYSDCIICPTDVLYSRKKFSWPNVLELLYTVCGVVLFWFCFLIEERVYLGLIVSESSRPTWQTLRHLAGRQGAAAEDSHLDP